MDRMEISDEHGRIRSVLNNQVRNDGHDCRGDYEDPLATKANQYSGVSPLGNVITKIWISGTIDDNRHM